MQGFVQGTDRQQTTLFPECLDDWVGESNPVRAVDVFVETQNSKNTLKSSRWCQSLLVESSFGMWSCVFTQPGSKADFVGMSASVKGFG
jgi:hypothetical protein